LASVHKKQPEVPLEKRSVILPFGFSHKQTRQAMKKLMVTACGDYLGRPLTDAETESIKQHTNPLNFLMIDLIFNGQKIGSISTTINFDIPRSIVLEFVPI
jgi:hypothetical protein